MTTVTIHGADVYIDGKPTYPGRWYQGHRIEGMLFNVRAVQAIFDDANPVTVAHWAYPDTGRWDPERNTDAFCEALPSWYDHGIRAFGVNLQGGGPMYVRDVYFNYDNNGFTPQGALRPAYAARLDRVLKRADALGMVANVGFFYWMMLNRMEDEAAVWRAAREACAFICEGGYRNVLVELANEIDVVVDHTPYSIFRADRQHEMLDTLRAEFPGLLFSTSGGGAEVHTGRGMPPASLVRSVDYILLHGNGLRPEGLIAAIEQVQGMEAYRIAPKPIIINEDSPALPNFEAAWPRRVSWGYYDQGWHGQGGDPWEDYNPRPRWRDDAPWEDLTGFQTPPVNWTINTPFKRAFFERVAEITGAR
ncbi:MAG: hypothetical protein ACOX2L_01710 [Anaerolineae bacterium]|jgi:hypothetical protein|nr:hypothetical protein [Chloroflexota bacterium]